MRKRLWSPDEDEKLQKYVSQHGFGNWSEVAKKTGLQRCGKSCRLRWINYLRPDLKRGKFSAEEKLIIVNLQKVFGNSWSKIAAHLPGRTDSDIKNFWHSHFRKKRPQQLLTGTSLMIPSAGQSEPTQYISSYAGAYSNSASSYVVNPNAAKAIARNPISSSLSHVMNPNSSCQYALSSDILSLLNTHGGLGNTMKQDQSNNYMQTLNHHVSSTLVPTPSPLGSSSPEDAADNIGHLYDPSKQHDGPQHHHQPPIDKVADRLLGSLCPEAAWYHGNKLQDVRVSGGISRDDHGNVVNTDDNMSKDGNALHMFMYGSMPHTNTNTSMHANHDVPPPEGLDLVVWSCVNRPNPQLSDQELITLFTPNITMPNIITHNTMTTVEQGQFLELE